MASAIRAAHKARVQGRNGRNGRQRRVGHGGYGITIRRMRESTVLPTLAVWQLNAMALRLRRASAGSEAD
eukprot:CAMPEP_0181177914 /NCGR_PEP_ID=MMETSP1096-20121128/5433_1 /TAXON_ID=156174 ORGANISM="Chrysochromulina ericina, Strain CCMP281" /NCGR_SAMPLE_ID=MMETSP1096 /ASSEMBLY_ACC=CAM_ASM_000453 /LENGTH=69 /DNA_ID=CAMNT_0023266133 /DNA_START=870 /DNA_END=1079 /DNA_ORIENTATION=-